MKKSIKNQVYLRDKNYHKNKLIGVYKICSRCGEQFITNYGTKKEPLCADCWNKR